jgi:tRNA pseudouridine32 synthase/23S rRNA pseudouridine746 synthase
MLTILFEDDRFAVVDKPAGLPCHAGPRGGASVEDFFPQISRKKNGPWLVHRLDHDTSGCLLIARKKTALIAAQTAFAEKRAEKTYWALVAGGPAADRGEISLPLAKINRKTGWRVEVLPQGDPALTEFLVITRGAKTCLLALTPRTGRTHQLRVHCAASGFPILGDTQYGNANAGPLMLHARHLKLPLIPPIDAKAPVPPAMQAAINALGG